MGAWRVGTCAMIFIIVLAFIQVARLFEGALIQGFTVLVLI